MHLLCTFVYIIKPLCVDFFSVTILNKMQKTASQSGLLHKSSLFFSCRSNNKCTYPNNLPRLWDVETLLHEIRPLFRYNMRRVAINLEKKGFLGFRIHLGFVVWRYFREFCEKSMCLLPWFKHHIVFCANLRESISETFHFVNLPKE